MKFRKFVFLKRFSIFYMRLVICFLILIFGISAFAQNIQSPDQFIGSEYGIQFTPHHRLVDYMEYISKASDRIEIEQYGVTNEGRPLYALYISSPKNLKNKELIRKTNLYHAGIEKLKPSILMEKSIVWLSYSVHGNEAGGSESSMNVIYKLATASGNQLEWLENTMVIVDPSLNPDGYNRYSQWVRGNSGKLVHPNHDDAEHMEPWPGGRVNHYLFDLNRDWAWQTQVESRQRIALYNQWLPHIHADLHEMGYDDHYYFAPAAEPYHKDITDWQRSFQYQIGQNHASYFDKEGWLYFTREIFDLLYPSYGDTWPTFNGSIGMTYEQAGHSMAGRAIEMSNGKILTLRDRIDHHTTTSLSTIEMASKNHTNIITNFSSYFKKSIENPNGKFQYYLIKNSVLKAEFIELMENNGIEISYINNDKSINGYSYLNDKNQSCNAQKGDVFISAKQPKSTLLQILMEQEPVLADSLTYDITSWCIPYAFQLDCYAFKTDPGFSISANNPILEKQTSVQKGSYGIAFRWSSNFDAKVFTSRLLNKGFIVKSVQRPIVFKDFTLSKGDIVLLNIDQNEEKNNMDIFFALAEGLDLDLIPLNTGFSLNGSDLGGTSLMAVEKPKVLTLFGDGVDANAYGQVWNYFENIIEYPLSRVNINRFEFIDLSDFNTLILPDGYYSLSEDQMTMISTWVDEGGKLISIAGANRNLKRSKDFALGNIEAETQDEDTKESQKIRDQKRNYEGAERRSISGNMPGAIFKTDIDTTHPLCFGISSYYTLKNSSSSYPLLSNDAFNPIRIPEDYKSYGFIGAKLEDSFQENFVFSVESKGSGTVIYSADNPLFRAFWKSGELIMANALFQVH